MNSFTLDLTELVASYTPRQTGVSLVYIYRLTGLLPSQIENLKLSKLSSNPDFVLLNSGKNNTLWFKKAIEFGLRNLTDIWEIKSDGNYVYQKINFCLNNPIWSSLSKGSYNFEKLYQSQKIISKLFYLPFIKDIYICGSQALEQTNEYSDTDLVLVCKSFFGLSTIAIVRFWIKVYLKINDRDVHPFLIHYLWLFCKKIKWTKMEKSLEYKYLNFKKSSRIRLDIGLIVDENIDLDKYTVKDVDRLGFLIKKKVLTQKEISKNLEPNYTIFFNDIKYRPTVLLRSLRFVFEAISVIFYPLFLLQFFWFWLFSSSDYNQYCDLRIWHSFSKVGYTKERLIRLKNNKIYLLHKD